jgi:aspartyl/glutamyl-tRNA(Asn/Gln) amidotransferase C subunit
MGDMISREEVERLAALARVQLSNEEVGKLQHDMTNILDYVGHISAANFEVQKEAILGPHNVMRDDELRKGDDQIAGKEAVLRAAFPKEKDGYNVVRKIIQKDQHDTK